MRTVAVLSSFVFSVSLNTSPSASLADKPLCPIHLDLLSVAKGTLNYIPEISQLGVSTNKGTVIFLSPL